MLIMHRASARATSRKLFISMDNICSFSSSFVGRRPLSFLNHRQQACSKKKNLQLVRALCRVTTLSLLQMSYLLFSNIQAMVVGNIVFVVREPSQPITSTLTRIDTACQVAVIGRDQQMVSSIYYIRIRITGVYEAITNCESSFTPEISIELFSPKCYLIVITFR